MSAPQYDQDGRELLTVYVEDTPVGLAASKSAAARIIRRYCAEELGDGDTGITAGMVRYSASRNAFVLDD